MEIREEFEKLDSDCDGFVTRGGQSIDYTYSRLVLWYHGAMVL